jgi:Icc-related predicted phosphoesterase
VQPDVTICGHIHEARGRHKLDGEHLVLNVAAVDAEYNLVEDPWVQI